MTEQNKLEKISATVRAMQNDRARFKIEADAWVEQQMKERREALELLVLEALEDHRVIEVAEAYTVSNKTPNRNAIHNIKRKYAGRKPIIGNAAEYPFEWRERSSLIAGKVAYDIYAMLVDFGPDKVSGFFSWRYIAGEIDPVITAEDPYPNTRYYQAVLANWLEANPYPGEQE